MPSAVPDVIATYQSAHDARDTDVALATFTADARVVDDGREHVGTDAVRAWLGTEAAQYTFTRTLVDAVPEGDDRWLVVNHLEGDFPGGEVDLRYRFRLVDDRIAELVIAP